MIFSRVNWKYLVVYFFPNRINFLEDYSFKTVFRCVSYIYNSEMIIGRTPPPHPYTHPNHGILTPLWSLYFWFQPNRYLTKNIEAKKLKAKRLLLTIRCLKTRFPIPRYPERESETIWYDWNVCTCAETKNRALNFFQKKILLFLFLINHTVLIVHIKIKVKYYFRTLKNHF